MTTAANRMPPGRTQRERSEATIAELVRAARRSFVAKGYAGTTLDEVAGAAGVTKGAVYHHFSGKRDLFRAVYEQEQQSLAEVSLAAYRRKRDPRQGFYEGCRAFFEASLDPGVQRITLIDAPAALGWDGMREVEDRYSMALIVNGLRLAIADGLIAKRPVEPLAHLIFGATCEGVMLVARSEDQRAMTRQVLAELKRLIDAI
jgi:AcrR family transcriptional regulator